MSIELTDRAQAAVSSALQTARDMAHSQLTPQHIALALLNDSNAEGTASQQPSRPGTPSNNKRAGDSLFSSVLRKAGADPERLEIGLRNALRKVPSQSPPPDEVSLASATTKLFKAAEELKVSQHDSFIAADHLLLALLADHSIKPLLKEAGLANEALLKTAILNSRGQRRVDSKSADTAGGLDDAISKYCTDLTELAEQGKLDPVIGRDDVIRRVIRILSRRRKNCAVLVGPAGTGKSAIAESLAQRIVDRDVPPALITKVLSLDVPSLTAGASYRGQFEERVKALVEALEKEADKGTAPVVFIDEVHLLTAGKESSGGMDAANMLKPALARGKLRVVAATTPAEHKKYILADAALERRFQEVAVDEPSLSETIDILRGLREKYELHHECKILDSSLVAAATLARRYLSNRKAPDAPLDLIDEAAADVRVSRDTVPEGIDKLQREKLRVEVAIHALEREKDEESKERLAAARTQLAKIDDELGPLIAAHEAEKSQADALANARRRLDDLRTKAELAERRYDLATASDLRHYAIPDTEARIKHLEDEERRKSERGESNQAVVRPEHIQQIVARWTGVPVTEIGRSDQEKLIRLPKILAREVVGQPEAVQAVAKSIQMQRTGLANPNQPASFLFCGGTGTGKTLCAKTLAKVLFGDENAMLRIDCSEYSEKHSVSKLLGAPAGYVGFDTEPRLDFIRRKPFSVILLDELEKASKEFIMMWLAILDDGVATTSQGQRIDFKNTIIIFTSNLGSSYISDATENGGPISPATRQLVDAALAAALPPEFRNRLSIIIFRNLTRDNIKEIVNLRLREIEQRIKLNGKRLKLSLTDAAKDYLASVGFNPSMGARPLNRAITNEVLSPLSLLMLRGQVLDKEEVHVDFDPIDNRIVVKANHAAAEGMDIDDDADFEDADMLDGSEDGFIEADPLD